MQCEKLKKLDIIWNRKDTKWENMYQIAKRFYYEFGNLMVNTHSTYGGENLGQWINKQRSDYVARNTDKRNSEFTEVRIKRLEEIGMIWDVNKYKWERMYDVAVQYYKEHNNLRIPSNCEYNNVNLGRWISNQRAAYRGRRGGRSLDEYQIQMLNKIGMKW